MAAAETELSREGHGRHAHEQFGQEWRSRQSGTM